MNHSPPSLIVSVVGLDRKQAGILTRIGVKLRQRGLQAHVLRSWRDTAIGCSDILLIGCGDDEVALLAEQMEHLWTQKWNRWYAAAQERRSASDVD